MSMITALLVITNRRGEATALTQSPNDFNLSQPRGVRTLQLVARETRDAALPQQEPRPSLKLRLLARGTGEKREAAQNEMTSRSFRV